MNEQQVSVKRAWRSGRAWEPSVLLALGLGLMSGAQGAVMPKELAARVFQRWGGGPVEGGQDALGIEAGAG